MKKALNIFIITLFCFSSSCTSPDVDCAKKIKDCAIEGIVNDTNPIDCLKSAVSQYLNIDTIPIGGREFDEFMKGDDAAKKASKLAIALRTESRNLTAPELNSKDLEELEEGLEEMAEYFDRFVTD